MSIRDALLRKDHRFEIAPGVLATLRRPSALDLIEAMQHAADAPHTLPAWWAVRCLVEDGRPVFEDLRSALDADGIRIARIGREMEKLLEEGRD